MKILLTGHEGYLGSQLRDYFTGQGHMVVGWGRSDDLAAISRTILDRHAVELVVNCATAANRSDQTYQVGGADEAVNVIGVRQLVLALAGTEIGLIHISTKDIYGDVYTQKDVRETGNRLVPSFSINERQPFRPKTIYAKTKLMGEFVAESHPKTTVIRLSSGYSSQLHRRGNWILNFCRVARKGSKVRINGTGKQLRDPLHADDLGTMVLLVHKKQAWNLKLNAGGGSEGSYSILEVLDLIKPGIEREFVPGGDLGYVTDNSLAEQILGWRPTRSLSRELAVLVDLVANE